MNKTIDNLSNARLETLLDSLEDGIIITDTLGNIVYINDSCSKILGFSIDELIGHSVLDKLSNCPIADALKFRMPVSGESYHFRDSGKECSYTVTPVIHDDQFGGLVGVLRQTAELGKLMKELSRSTSIIESIYERIADLNGCTDYTNSDVVPIDRMEQVLLRQALIKYGYTVEGKKMAAKALNISLATLYNKLKKYQIS